MKKKLLKEIVTKSYNEGILNPEIVEIIANHLGRKELKQYINALKQYEQIRTVVIESAKPVNDEQKKLILENFKDKKTSFVTNASLITGVRITDNDMIYEANLKNIFDKIVQHIEEQYD